MLSYDNSVSKLCVLNKESWWARVVCLFLLSMIGWSPVYAQVGERMIPSTGGAFDYFGEAVSLNGNFALIGSWLEDVNGTIDQGSATVFQRVDGRWIEEATLVAGDPQVEQHFGIAVAIEGAWAVVGARNDNNAGGARAGAVYVYERIAEGQWEQRTKIVAPDGNLEDQFGAAVSFYQGRLLVGAPGAGNRAGAAYVFERFGSVWTFLGKLEAEDGAPGHAFGATLSLGLEGAVIGAAGYDTPDLADTGSVYVFGFINGEWVLVDQLSASNGAGGARFGASVALDSTRILVGADGHDSSGLEENGAGYIFEKQGSDWREVHRIEAVDAGGGDNFGASVALQGRFAVIGARWHRNAQGQRAGAAYLYEEKESGWEPFVKLIAPDGSVGDQFGYAVDFDVDHVLVGARWDDNENGEDAGAAFAFPVAGAGLAVLATSMQDVQFGDVLLGETSEETLSLSNVGTADLAIEAIGLEGEDRSSFEIVQGGAAATLAPFASLDIRIRFSPFSSGLKTARVLITTNTAEQSTVINLVGQGAEGVAPALTRVLASRGEVASQFGSAIALSGEYALVGASGADAGQEGATYMYRNIDGQWGLHTRIEPLDPAQDSRFGDAVAMNNDFAVIGARGEDDNQGAVYVFQRSGSAWIQQARLEASDGAPGDQFGAAVSIEGVRLLVGAPEDDNSAGASAGAAYVFNLSGGAWQEQAKLTSLEGQQGDRFGSAVEQEDEMLVVGAANGGFFGEGLAYVFGQQGAVWQEEGVLRASDAGLSDGFGSSLSLQGDFLAVGAPIHDNGTSADEGAVYVFQRGTTEWTERARLTASDGTGGANFGSDVILDQDLIYVGASGVRNQRGGVYVFERSGSTWTETGSFEPAGAEEGDRFGRALALSANQILVGAPDDANINGNVAGASYVFVQNGSGWEEQAILLASSWRVEPHFGTSVAVLGSLAVVGAEGKQGTGAAIIYQRSGTTWTQVAELVNPNGQPGDRFGRAVALVGNYVVVGAPGEDNEVGENAGAVYVYLQGTDQWSLQARLVLPQGSDNDAFGSAIAMTDQWLVVGAPLQANENGEEAGIVGLFRRDGAGWVFDRSLIPVEGKADGQFGSSVDVHAETILVGAPSSRVPGSAYLFERSGDAWEEVAQFTESDGSSSDLFGASVALDETMALVGAPAQQWVRVYQATNGIWRNQYEAQLEPETEAEVQFFGASVDLFGEQVLVGAPGDEQLSGATFFFEKQGESWLQQSVFNGDQDAGDAFGQGVSLDGATGLVGAPFDENGNGDDAGAVYFIAIDPTATHRQSLPIPVSGFVLEQNYPNPASATAYITFMLQDRGEARLEVFDLLGRTRIILLDQILEAGQHEVALDTSNWPAGTYFYRLRSKAGMQTRSMVVLH